MNIFITWTKKEIERNSESKRIAFENALPYFQSKKEAAEKAEACNKELFALHLSEDGKLRNKPYYEEYLKNEDVFNWFSKFERPALGGSAWYNKGTDIVIRFRGVMARGHRNHKNILTNMGFKSEEMLTDYINMLIYNSIDRCTDLRCRSNASIECILVERAVNINRSGNTPTCDWQTILDLR